SPHSCPTRRSSDLLGVVPVVVVEHVHRVSVSHARVTGVGAVEVVVVVGRPQMSFVLGVPVAVPDQRRLVVVEEVVPGDRHVVGLALDVDRAVVTVGEAVVVDPDVGRSLLDVDGVVVPIGEGDVTDDDVVDTAEVEPTSGDLGIVQTDDRGVRGDLVHAGQLDGPVDLDGQRGIVLQGVEETVLVVDGDGVSVGTSGGSAVLGGPADRPVLGGCGVLRADGFGVFGVTGQSLQSQGQSTGTGCRGDDHWGGSASFRLLRLAHGVLSSEGLGDEE